MPLALLALTISAFAIGTTEFVIVGLLPTIAADLQVGLPSAGLLVSLYALGVAIGAPLLTAMTGHVARKTLLLGLMLLFTAGNLLAWQAPGYGTLMLARILTGMAHGVFFSVSSTIAAGLVARDKAARAIATMFSGLTVALATGVPLGTYIGQHFGWRASFFGVACLGVLALLACGLLLPRQLAQAKPAPWRQQVRVLQQPRLLLAYAMTALCYGGSFAAFTYLAPILQQITGLTPAAVSLVLLGYGVSVALGNVWGGHLADRHGPLGALKVLFFGLACVLLVFGLSARLPWLAVLTVLFWGAFAFGNIPALQLYVVRLAERDAPQAPDVASGLNIAAFNVGIACGAWGGGQIVSRIGVWHTTWVGALVVLGAWMVARYSQRRDRRQAAVRPRHDLAGRRGAG